MRLRLGPLLGWGSLALSVALMVVSAYITATLPAAVPKAERPASGGISYFLVALGFSAVGAYLASRRDGNRIAWMACGIGLGINVAGFGFVYPLLAKYGGARHLPGWDAAAARAAH